MKKDWIPCTYDGEECFLAAVMQKAWTHEAGVTHGSFPAGQEALPVGVVVKEDGSIITPDIRKVKIDPEYIPRVGNWSR